MVVKMMRWRPWPPVMTRKYEARVVVRRMEGAEEGEGGGGGEMEGGKNGLSSLRRRATVRRNWTREEEVGRGGVVEWNEEFQSVCNLSGYKDNAFLPWEITFSVLDVSNQGAKNKVPVVGTVSLNVADFASATEEKEIELNIPLTVQNGSTMHIPSLCLSFSLLELRTTQEQPEAVQQPMATVPLSPRPADTTSTDSNDLSALKAGLRKVKILTDYVSTRRAKKACRDEEDSEGRLSARSEDAEYRYPFDSESAEDFDDTELEEGKDGNSSFRKSFSYGSLAHANYTGGTFYSEMRINGEHEDWVYYSNRRSDVGRVPAEDTTVPISEHSILQSSKRSILSWKKRKLSFRSPKAKGEPLLKKAYAEDGGDDIDFDRRQLNPDGSLALGWYKTDEGSSTNRSSVSEFGDDNFAVGSWEHKEVISRDGQMKLSAQVFFASIDQRSERAAGESACTALVAVIADWFQTNQDTMPIKSQLDTLIREGSLEWRNLCENETYRELFPDKHFDLDTVLQAKIRPLGVAQEKSFIGFFHPEGMEEGGFDFLQGAMSFDSIWDEISHTGLDCNSDPQIYIVSWNDHFFILKVEPEAYYIIDTLGERLHEGCNQAYILKFDRDTAIYRLPNGAQSSEDKPSRDKQNGVAAETGNQSQPNDNQKQNSATALEVATTDESSNSEGEEEVVCKGKESCKEYIKSFLAAIPIRELQTDIKKGLLESTPLHHRLQIEFHYTNFLQPVPESLAVEDAAATMALAVTVVGDC
ncbi:hypothetical protein Scep_003486 [Stephania cephalantha]|uniref:C2 NT-type domain-containing protein n=1 Tax=Stephania cephalantha TaxID=152367 RepID=A0AAP0KQK8_9MAGN